jgi:hypothetical protein
MIGAEGNGEPQRETPSLVLLASFRGCPHGRTVAVPQRDRHGRGHGVQRRYGGVHIDGSVAASVSTIRRALYAPGARPVPRNRVRPAGIYATSFFGTPRPSISAALTLASTA